MRYADTDSMDNITEFFLRAAGQIIFETIVFHYL